VESLLPPPHPARLEREIQDKKRDIELQDQLEDLQIDPQESGD
jgi:hypothetical protein